MDGGSRRRSSSALGYLSQTRENRNGQMVNGDLRSPLVRIVVFYDGSFYYNVSTFYLHLHARASQETEKGDRLLCLRHWSP